MPRRWLDSGFFMDEKLGRLPIPERLLFAAMVANQDDDGRLKGHPAYLRSIAFPYDEFSTDQVKQMRDRIAEENPNVIVYGNAGEEYIQLKRHKRYQKPRYYHPSKLPAPPGWPFEEQNLVGNHQVTNKTPNSNHLVTKQYTEDRVGRGKDLDLDLDKDKDKIGGKPSPPPTTQSILNKLKYSYESGWGMKAGGKVSAQLRDLAEELSAAGCPLDYIEEAFKEAARMNKYSIRYVRKILLAWLGTERAPPK